MESGNSCRNIYNPYNRGIIRKEVYILGRETITRKELFRAMKKTLEDFGRRAERGSISSEFYQGAALAIERIKHELDYDKMKLD